MARILVGTRDGLHEFDRPGGLAHRRGGLVDGLRANCMADIRVGVVMGASEGHLLRVAGDGLEPVPGFERVEGRRAGSRRGVGRPTPAPSARTARPSA